MPPFYHYARGMDEEKKITLRLPAALHQWLTAQAKSARRSLNSEIVHRLEAEPTTITDRQPKES
jgi:predicted HicB family RNase H-like nuclease